MNVVFLSPHFPPNWFRFAVALRGVGATVLGIADLNYEQLNPELRDALDDYYRVDDLGDYEQLTRALGYFIHRHGRIDRIDSLNEHWLETEAALRTDFNIPGINSATIGAIKRKSVMKQRFIDAGLAPGRGRICPDEADLRQFIAEVGLPVVAKPDVGVGAARTYKIENEAELEAYLADQPSTDYIVEEFVRGELLTYDGLAGRDGEIVFDSSFQYSRGVMEVVNAQLDIYYWMPRAIPADVQEVGRAMARAFDLRERPFHFEIFRTPSGALVPLEVNMRPPGGWTVDMWNYSNDFDFYHEWASILVDGVFDAEIARPYNVLYASRRDGRPYVMTHDEVLADLGDLIVHESRMERVLASAMGDHGYVLRNPELEPLIDAARRLQALQAAE
ncbi:MAG: ATP-grasp domain-containing protein [Chloroflexota bacterium]|nr:ATP-grasp domain-containing protein [Chloroflexota bacterium]